MWSNDGEFGKTMWTQYVIDRLDGVEAATRRRHRAQMTGATARVP